MENKFTPELIEKAKSAKTPEELLTLARENGTALTEESAKAYFELLHPQAGELADEELDNVAGGTCYNGDRPVVTVGHRCDEFVCKSCPSGKVKNIRIAKVCSFCGSLVSCGNCFWCTYEKGLWLCNHRR